MNELQDKLLPLSIIRSFTQTDDDVYVTDDELIIFRGAAFSALEKYTNISFSGVKDIQERVEILQSREGYIYPQNIKLKHPCTSSYVVIKLDSGAIYKEYVPIGEKSLRFIPREMDLYLNNCSFSPYATVFYKTGYDCPKELDENIKLGLLSFINYYFKNKNDTKLLEKAAVLSGALDLWKE